MSNHCHDTRLAVTKLDILDTFKELKVCTGYKLDGKDLPSFPADHALLERIEPVYTTIKVTLVSSCLFSFHCLTPLYCLTSVSIVSLLSLLSPSCILSLYCFLLYLVFLFSPSSIILISRLSIVSYCFTNFSLVSVLLHHFSLLQNIVILLSGYQNTYVTS